MLDFMQQTSDSIVITPNSRLSRYLRREFEQSFLVAKNKIQLTPNILPLQVWLQQVYQANAWQFEQTASILTPQQERLIWQDVIANSELGANLLQTEATAKLAQQAYRSLMEWRIPLSQLTEQQSIDATALKQWITLFTEYCTEHSVLSSVDVIGQLINNLANIKTSLAKKITLYAFDEIPPTLEHFFTLLQTRNITVESYQPSNPASSQQWLACHDLQDEITTMARWARQAHQQNPAQKILCVVPNLTQVRPLVLQTFAQVFFPESVFSTEFTQDIYNISGGYALHNAPIIYIALQILRCNTHSIAIEALTTLLTSPFIQGYFSEADARAEFDLSLRELNNPRLTWKTILQHATEHLGIDQLQIQLVTFIEALTNLPKAQNLAYWHDKFFHLLKCLGWPGERNLNSVEHQQVKRFYDLLQELPSLSVTPKDFSYSQAVRLLDELVRNTLFEIESHDGPVQVLGVLEAAGTCNDQLWFMHLDDETWPQKPKPNPFIPFQLQTEHNMPHCNAERELDFSKRLMASLQQTNANCYFSYHQHDGDKTFSKSPLLAGLAQINTQEFILTDITPLAQTQITENAVHYIDDDIGPVLTEAVAKGGTGIFKSQAACPFQAFARYRLQASGIPTPESGLNHLDRGILLHSCLDKIWQQLKTQQSLLAMPIEKLHSLVSLVIEDSLQHALSKELQPVFKTLETTRLQHLLLSWLELEKQRPAFQVVAHEQWRQITIGRIKVNVQIDRLDKLSNDEKLVIDYKSGKPSLADWFGSRPKEPQLPLYCLSEPNITGISFGQVRIDDLAFKGVSSGPTDIKGILPIEKASRYAAPENWQQLVSEWQVVLDDLADDFMAGNALVDPVAYNTCDHCDLHSLCRINERLELSHD
jgi:probable DNA repair protein